MELNALLNTILCLGYFYCIREYPINKTLDFFSKEVEKLQISKGQRENK